METTGKQTKYNLGLRNRLISGSSLAYYSIYEPIMLRLARLRHGGIYKDGGKDPLVSIYVPTYNRVQILMDRAVASVLAQTYKNFEFIIIGDCCTDNTEELVSKIGDPRIKFYNLPKRGYRYPPTIENHWLAGPVVPANKALELISGEWTARIDDDDIWTADHIETLLRFAQKGNFEFASGQYTTERFGKRVLHQGFGARDHYHTLREGPVVGKNSKIGGTSTWLYRSYLKLFKYNINCWRKSWNRVNDIDLSLRMFNAGVRMGFIEKNLCFTFPRPGEQTVGIQAYELSKEDKLKHYSFGN